MKTYLSVIFLNLLFVCCNSSENKESVWTTAYEAKWHRQIDSELKLRLPDDDDREDMLNYIIKRFKTELPNGIESVSADSVNKLSVKIGKDYAYSHVSKKHLDIVPATTAWTKQMEQLLREAFLTDSLGTGNKLSVETCNCIIRKLKKTYPDSVILPFPKDVIDRVAYECADNQ